MFEKKIFEAEVRGTVETDLPPLVMELLKDLDLSRHQQELVAFAMSKAFMKGAGCGVDAIRKAFGDV